MQKNRKTSIIRIKNESLGYGLVDSIISLALMSGLISYSIYFASVRMDVAYRANTTSAINNEIARDLERLKADIWSTNYNKKERRYDTNLKDHTMDCNDITKSLLSLNNWNKPNSNIEKNYKIQSWYPESNANNIYRGNRIKISRELTAIRPINIKDNGINKSVANIEYSVTMNGIKRKWLNINLGAEVHAWCPPMS